MIKEIVIGLSLMLGIFSLAVLIGSIPATIILKTKDKVSKILFAFLIGLIIIIILSTAYYIGIGSIGGSF